MKIIEALKKRNELIQKAEDLKHKINKYCAQMNFETPVYGDKQKDQINEWLQAHGDVIKEIEQLSVAIQKTNILTEVEISFGQDSKDKEIVVKKSIAAWIHRRRNLAKMQEEVYAALNDKNLKEGAMKGSTGEYVDCKIVRFYDPKDRDYFQNLYHIEPGVIDRRLEVINATTDLVA